MRTRDSGIAEESTDRSGHQEATSPAPRESAPTPLQVAYHAGPPDLTYAGRLWYRGTPQTVTPGEWSAMQARLDFAPFEFRVE